MTRLLAIAAMVLGAVACSKAADGGASTSGQKAAAPVAQPAPGPGNTPAPNGDDKMAGRVFRMKAGGQMPDPNKVKAAIEQGKALPGGIEEIGKESQERDAARDAAKQKAIKTVTDMYSMIADKPMDVLEVTEASGMWRITFQTRGVKEAPSTVHVTKDGKLAFEGGFELQRRHERLQIDHNFAQCLHVRGVHVIGDGRTKEATAQLKEIGSFAGKIFVDCGRTKDGCAPLMKKLGVQKLPVIEQGSDRFTGPRPRSFLETLSGCK